MTKPSSDERMDDFDDFLAAAPKTSAFVKSKTRDAPSYDNDRSDKSMGWPTQK
jgi:hypothetical protein